MAEEEDDAGSDGAREPNGDGGLDGGEGPNERVVIGVLGHFSISCLAGS